MPHCAFDELNSIADPAIKQEVKEFLENAIPQLSSVERNSQEPLLSIAVVVHVIHEGEPIGTGRNLSADRIRAQIDVLNEDYASLNPEYFNTPGQWMGLAGTPNIQFRLANVDPDGNPTDGIDRQELTVTGTSWNNNNINSFIKPQTNWNPDKYLNIYVVSIPGTTAAGGVVGYSNYPTPGQIGGPSDGPVIDYNWFGAPGFGASGYRPLTHEIGHFLGLPHTFNGSSCNSDDNISDTPNVDDATSEYMLLDCDDEYPTGPSSCGNEHLFVNYMDYVTENCYTSFTQGQVNVIRSVLDGTSNQFNYGSREDLVTNAPLLCDLPANDAGIVRLISPEETYCTADSVSPVVSLRNFGVANLTSADIIYRVNGGAPIEMLWQGDMFPGENIEVTLPKFMPPDGGYVIEFFTENPSGMPDERVSNDTLAEAQFANVAIMPPMIEDFEDEIGFPTNEGVFDFNVTADQLAWEMTADASAFGEGQQAAVINNFAAANWPGTLGSIDALITRHFDLSEMTNTELRFDVAYAPFDDLQSDTLYVLVATDCSQNFNQGVFAKGGSTLATSPATEEEFTPFSGQWRTEVVNLSAFDGMDDVTIAFVNKSGWGNRLFLDNLRVGRSCNSLTAVWQTGANGCGPTCTGNATVEIPENNGGLNYQWEGWPSSHNLPTVYQLCPGAVTVTVTDAFGCEVIASTEIQQSPEPEASTSSTEVSAFGATDGTATAQVVNGNPPFTYSWSNGVEMTSSSFSNTLSNLAEGSYTVEITDATDCMTTVEVEVGSVCDVFSVSTPTTHVSCFGESDGSIMALPLNGVGAYQFEWSNGASTQLNTGLMAGTYQLTVTDANGCPAETSATVTQPTEIELTVNSTGVTSVGASDGTVSVFAEGGSPGYDYLWSNGSIMPVQTGLPVGSYSVTVTDLSGCTSTGVTSVQSFNCDDFGTIISWTNLTCFGADDGTATVDVENETQPVTYSWSNGGMTQTIENLPAGDYSVTVVDGAGCSAELVASVQSPTELIALASATNETGPGANDGTATVEPIGGFLPLGEDYGIEWSNGETTLTIENLAPGEYTVTITDFNDCAATDVVTVSSANCALTIQTSANAASCSNVADGLGIVVNVPGAVMPLEYLWSNGDLDLFAENLLPDDYTVTVTDANGCTVVGEVTIEVDDQQPPTLQLAVAELQLDANGLLTVNPADVDAGSFDNCDMVNLEVSPNIFTCDDVGENEVTVTATDASGNISTGTTLVIISETTPPIATCPDDLTVMTCAEVEYDIPTAEDNCGIATIYIIEGFESGDVFPAGTTTVVWEAADPSDNISTCSFEVTVEYDLAVGLTGTSPSCPGDSDGVIDVFISGGNEPYQATWSHGGGSSNLPAGEYTVTVTDQEGCTSTSTVELQDPEPLEVTLVDVTPANDINTPGSISFSISGGTPNFTLTWFDEDGNELPDFDPAAAPAGTYSVEVEDSRGCTSTLEDISVDLLNSTSSTLLERQLELFPNPTSGKFFLKISIEELAPVQLTVFDVTGKSLLSQTFEIFQNQTWELDVEKFNAGVFWVKIQVGEAVAWRKLVKI